MARRALKTTYSFNLRRRLRGALPPLAVAAALLLLLVVVRPERQWAFWLLVGLAGVLLFRGALYLMWGRRELSVDATGITRSGKTVPFAGAELELRCVEKAGSLRVHEVVLWEPRGTGDQRQGVGFDESLDDFEQAIRAVFARVPEMRVRVSTLGEVEVKGARAEQVLAPLRPTPAERALAELGTSALSPPPQRRN